MFYDIFEQLCTSKNIKPNTATKALGLSSATATNWKTSGRVPNGETLAKIADYFNCSVDYLLGRTDAPDADSSLKAHSDESQGLSSEFMFNSVKQRGISSMYELSAKYKDLIDLYENANDQARRIAKFALEVGKRDSRQDNNYSNTLSEPDNTSFEYIRHYFVPAAAGYASPIEGEDYELIERDKNTPSNADFCINIDGDSMEPYIHDRELVYVQRDTSLADFDVGIFFVDGDVLCKQYCIDNMGNLYLLSANPQREDANRIISRESSSTVVCFGKVLLKNKLPKPNYY